MSEEMERREDENEVSSYGEGIINNGCPDMATSQSFMNMQSPKSKRVYTRKKEKRRREDHVTNISDGIVKATSIIANEISKATEVFSKVMGVEAMISEKRQQLYAEIRKVPDLTLRERIKVVCYVARDHELTDVFFSYPEEERGDLVRAVLSGDI